MTVENVLSGLLEAAAEAGARRAIEQLQTTTASRWIPLRESPLGYRPTLDLIRAGALSVHGIGNRKYLDREMVDAWLLAHPIAASVRSVERDEIDLIVDSHRQRQAKRKGAK